MLVSYLWLQKYFKKKLPSPKELSETLIFHSFEVESIKDKDNDSILDIKILPDRAHDALSHRGISRELAIHLSNNIYIDEVHDKIKNNKTNLVLNINNTESTLCKRYSGRIIENIRVGRSPSELKTKLEAIGQKSINNIVDAINHVMFDVGQPLHAFDAKKVVGDIVVRKAKNGEKITTLDLKTIMLDTETLLIADEEGPLAIAGIKGGTKAEITEKTTSIILESANFESTNIRKTSRRLGIQTDSSRRFENEVTPTATVEALDKATSLILDMEGNGDAKVGNIFDVYPHPINPYKIGVSLSEVNNLLGTGISKKELVKILEKLKLQYIVVENPREKVIEVAKSLVGSLYKRPSAMQYDAPKAFSCTSLISYVYVEAGIYMPSLAIDKYVYGKTVEKKHLKPGDIVFANTNEGSNGKAPVIYHETVEWKKGEFVKEGVDHAGIYLGGGEILHTSWKIGKAVVEKLDSSEQFKNIVGYKSFIDADEERYVVTIPNERLDLRRKENVIEDIGRTYGYQNIKSKNLVLKNEVKVNKEFYYTNKIRNILAEEGYSEIYSSSFTNDGEYAVQNPSAVDKGFLRKNLSDMMSVILNLNAKNAPLLSIDMVKIFEIGKVWKLNGEIKGEQNSLILGVRTSTGFIELHIDNLKKTFDKILNEFNFQLGYDIKQSPDEALIEINMDTVLDRLPDPTTYDEQLEVIDFKIIYKKSSTYPFVLRDIALFVPSTVHEAEVIYVIKNNAGDLLIREPRLFDRFRKKNKETGAIEKISFAFKLVFQSEGKTLSDDEVNVVMEKITNALNSIEGWKVR